MSDTHLRRTERDLYAAAQELREADIPDIREQRDHLVGEVRKKYDSADAIPREKRQEYERLGQQLRELVGTADTYEEYAERWGDGEECTFVLEELNGDEYAAVLDAVSAEAERQGRREGIPEGHGQVKALEYGVVGEELPPGAPPDPGEWPAPVVTELFAALQEITAPGGVELGNESLADAFAQETTGSDTPAER